jgi:glycerate kinase
VFGPQKGATPEVVRELDDALRALAHRLGKLDEAAAAGAGAAGGLGFGMLAYFPNATLRPGFEIVTDATNLRQRLAGADLCLTGEGRFDASTLSGKTVAGVARLCRELGVPCVAIVGATGDGASDAARELGIEVKAISDAKTPAAAAMAAAGELLSKAAAEVVKVHRNGRRGEPY